jgi:solute carrier family 25 phosphate transporter 3
MVKFSTFENTVNAMYRYVFTDAKSSYSMLTQLGITFVSGFFAGCLCAIVSHPGDTLVSIMNKPEYANSTKSTTQRMR